MQRGPIPRGGKLTLKRRQGSPYWQAVGTIGGKEYRRSTGCTEKTHAEDVARRWEQQLHDQRIYGEEAVMTFADAVREYAETGRDTRFLESLLDYFGVTPIMQITPRQVTAAARNIYPNTSNSTINRQVISPVSAVINLALKGSGHAKRAFPKLPEPKGRLLWITPEEAEALIAAAAETGRHGAGDLPIMIQVLLGTGLRRSELFAMERGDLHVAAGQIFVPYEKAGDGRMVPMPTRAQSATATLEPRTARVWRTPAGKSYTIKSMESGWSWTGFQTAVKLAGLEGVTPHTLRHTFATWYAAYTNDLITLQSIGGWSRLATLQRYTKVAPSDLKERLQGHGWHFGLGENPHNPHRIRTLPEPKIIRN